MNMKILNQGEMLKWGGNNQWSYKLREKVLGIGIFPCSSINLSFFMAYLLMNLFVFWSIKQRKLAWFVGIHKTQLNQCHKKQPNHLKVEIKLHFINELLNVFFAISKWSNTKPFNNLPSHNNTIWHLYFLVDVQILWKFNVCFVFLIKNKSKVNNSKNGCKTISTTLPSEVNGKSKYKVK